MIFSSKQFDLYDETFRPIVEAVLEGYNGTLHTTVEPLNVDILKLESDVLVLSNRPFTTIMS